MSNAVSQTSTVRRRRLGLCALLVVLTAPLFGGYAQAQLCQMGCGNRCYGSSNPSACESMCINRCSANGGNQGGVSAAPRQVWQPRFAAFAETADHKYWGVSTEYYNSAEAAAGATAACEKLAKRSCPVVRGTDGINVALLGEEEDGKTIGLIIKAGETMADAVNPMIRFCHQHHPNAKCVILFKNAGR